MRKDIRQLSRPGKLVNKGRYLKASALGTLGFCTRCAVDAHGLRPEWIEVVEINLRLPNVPDGLVGTRIAHISDLHYSRTVTTQYLRRCVNRINQLGVDIVVLTGDYITYDIQGKFREKVIALLGSIRSRLGSFACLGNHDYGVRVLPRARRNYLLHNLIQGMEAVGITVLRNESRALNIDGHPLWLVGLGDLTAGDFHASRAFAKVPPDQITIALMHDPRGAHYLDGFKAHAVVSGHTHGKKPRLGAVYASPIRSRRFHAGLHDVDGKKLYVNRGLGRVGRPRLNARPEIAVLTCRAQSEST
jgi:predicted MPP superfamily phosphohydrolase